MTRGLLPPLLRKTWTWFALVAVGYVETLYLGLSGHIGDRSFAPINRVFSGAMVSFPFYYLVVRLPELRRPELYEALTRFEAVFTEITIARNPDETRAQLIDLTRDELGPGAHRLETLIRKL